VKAVIKNKCRTTAALVRTLFQNEAHHLMCAQNTVNTLYEEVLVMSERFLSRSAVMLLLTRETNGETEILLQKRQNTGYADGMWDCAATGHVDAGESMKMAVVREAKEELGIDIPLSQARFSTITHVFTPSTGKIYYNAYFCVSDYRGLPSIMEPHKCDDLAWFNIHNLPSDLIPDRAIALHNYLMNIPYDEIGWNNESV